jgi:hypothetical protein
MTFSSWTMRAALALLPGYATVANAAEAAIQPVDAAATQSQDSVQAEAPAGPQIATSTEQLAPSKKWQFSTIGYLWLARVNGKTDVIGPVPPVDLNLSVADVLKNFKFIFMGAAEVRHDRLVFLGDLMFVHVGGSAGVGIRDPDFLEAELDSRTLEITFVGGYRVADNGPVKVDLLAGGRMNWFQTGLRVAGPNREAEGEVTENWFDPVVAARVGVPLGGKWSASAYGDVGGFGIGSDITWQATGSVNYQVNHKLRLGLGWRSFKVHFDHGDFLYDVAQNGPIIVFRTDF